MDNNTQLIKVPFAKDPVNLGFYDELVAQGKTSFGIMNRVNRYGCEWESLVDNNTDAPAVWDGGDTITPSENWKLNAGNPEAWLMNQNKPATSEQYPFNGMGRVKLQKHIVDGHNLLYQDDFYKGEVGSRVPNTNTVFEVPYEFELAEDITIPANCVLDFQCGSISGINILTFSGTYIKTNKSFSITCPVSGNVSNKEINPDVFGVYYDDNTHGEYNGNSIQKCVDILPSDGGTLKFSQGIIYVDAIENESQYVTHSNAPILITRNNLIFDFNGATIKVTANNYDNGKLIVVCSGASNIVFKDGYLIGDVETHTSARDEHCHGIQLNTCRKVTIKNMEINDFCGDGINLSREWGTGLPFGENGPKQITIHDCKCKYNYRHGMSITHGQYITIKECTFTENGSKFAAPLSCALDVEGNDAEDFIGDIDIIDCNFTNNSYSHGDHKPANMSFWCPGSMTDDNFGGLCRLINVNVSNTNGVIDRSNFGAGTLIENIEADIFSETHFGKSTSERQSIKNSKIKRLDLNGKQIKYVDTCIIGSPDTPMDNEYTYCMLYIYTNEIIVVSNSVVRTKDQYGVNGKYAIKSSDYHFSNCLFENVGTAGSYTLNKDNAEFLNCSAIGLTLGT